MYDVDHHNVPCNRVFKDNPVVVVKNGTFDDYPSTKTM